MEAARLYDKEYGYPSFTWEAFGLKWNDLRQDGKDPYLHCYVIDKDKLVWAMIKYGFNVYYADVCE